MKSEGRGERTYMRGFFKGKSPFKLREREQSGSKLLPDTVEQTPPNTVTPPHPTRLDRDPFSRVPSCRPEGVLWG